jgi:hypothetical protein
MWGKTDPAPTLSSSVVAIAETVRMSVSAIGEVVAAVSVLAALADKAQQSAVNSRRAASRPN